MVDTHESRLVDRQDMRKPVRKVAPGLRGVVARLTRRHEAAEPKPWKMTDSAPEYIDDLLSRIVGIEITLTSLVGKSKLSQNREARDRLGAADVLAARGHDELAQRMRETGSGG